LASSTSSSESRKYIGSGLAPGDTPPVRHPIFYYITDRKALSSGSALSSIRRAVSWGIDYVQIRERDLSDRDLFKLIGKTLDLVKGTRCRLLVNGRADLALAAGAHGVHLPSKGIRASEVFTWLPSDFIVGVSVHSLKEARDAASEGAHYLLLGPLFPTLSKLRYGSPLGLTAFHRICSTVQIPILGLGGIHPGSVPLVLKAGAAGIAGISLFQQDLVAKPMSREELVRGSSRIK
jgi:thiamine-phosphate pyrophosphorylase